MSVEEFTWSDLLVEAVVLLGIYFLLRFADKRLITNELSTPFVEVTRKIVHTALLIFEPLVVLILVSTFVLVNPLLHGVIVGGIAIVGFPYLRHYLSGRLMQFDPNIKLGKQIKVEDHRGVVSVIGRTGLYLQTEEGRRFTNYTDLYKNGYTLTDREEIGGFYNLEVKAPEGKNTANDLLDIMATLPYLDWNHRPKVRISANNNRDLQVQISVKEEKHLYELIRALSERNYECSMPA